MSYIPDCRPKMKKESGPFPYERMEEVKADEINPYWYGLVDGEDKHFLCGYDWNTERVVNNLFDNLDVYANEFEQIGIDVRDIDEKIVNGAYEDMNIHFNEEFKDTRECKWFCDYSMDEIEEMNMPTKVMLLVKYMVNDYIEMQRDMLVTSMIEDVDEDAYDDAVKKASENE